MDRPFSTHAKFSKKNVISYPLTCKRTYAYQVVRNDNVSEDFAYILNG